MTCLVRGEWCMLCVWCCMATVRASPDAKRLYDDLLRQSGYNKLIRPVGNTSDTLIVRLGLRLTQIIDVVSWMMMMMIGIIWKNMMMII